MKYIAIFVDDYMPNSTKVAAKMMHELACELLKHGCVVSVFTPDATIVNKYELSRLDGVNVYRFRSGIIKNCSMIRRGINEALLSARASYALKAVFDNNHYDLIINYSPTIFFGGVVTSLKKKNNSPSYLILRDFFPQWIIDNGIIGKNSLAAKFFRFFERYNYQSANVIAIQSKNNIKVFEALHGNKYNTQLLYNWADTHQSDKITDYREKHKLQDKIIFLYGGNIGKAQDIKNLLRLAEKFNSVPDAHFLFVGQGDEVELIHQAVANGSKNITLLPPISQDEFKGLLKEVDIGLFSLAKSHISHNFPGKILGYMVNFLPILGSINDGNDLKEIVEQSDAGLISINGDDDLFYANAFRLYNDKALRIQQGRKARQLLLDKFSVSSAASHVLAIQNLEVKSV